MQRNEASRLLGAGFPLEERCLPGPLSPIGGGLEEEAFDFLPSVLSEIFVMSRHYFFKVFLSIFVIGSVLPFS